MYHFLLLDFSFACFFSSFSFLINNKYMDILSKFWLYSIISLEQFP